MHPVLPPAVIHLVLGLGVCACLSHCLFTKWAGKRVKEYEHQLARFVMSIVMIQGQNTTRCKTASSGRAFPGETLQQRAVEDAHCCVALQQELVVVSRQLDNWKADHSWTLQQSAEGREKEKAQMEGQLRYFTQNTVSTYYTHLPGSSYSGFQVLHVRMVPDSPWRMFLICSPLPPLQSQ